MGSEIGYIVSVESMREYHLRRDEGTPNGHGGRGGPGAPDGGGGVGGGGLASADVGTLVKVGRGTRPLVAVVTGVTRAIHEELQPYLPSAYQPKYLPSQEDFRDSYLSLYALGELPGEQAETRVETADTAGKESGVTPPWFRVERVPELSDPVSPLNSEEIARFHNLGGTISLGYLGDLTRTLDPDVLLRLLELVKRASGSGGFASADPALDVKFRAIRRYIGKGVRL